MKAVVASRWKTKPYTALSGVGDGLWSGGLVGRKLPPCISGISAGEKFAAKVHGLLLKGLRLDGGVDLVEGVHHPLDVNLEEEID